MAQVELNGQVVTRENVKDWLRSKRITLWSDWCISDPKRMEIAVDWFMAEMTALSGTVKPTDGPDPVKGKRAKANGKQRTVART